MYLQELNNRLRSTADDSRIKCETMEGKNEVLEKQQEEFLTRVEYLENQAAVVEKQHEAEIKEWKEMYQSKCNENQQVCYMSISFFMTGR